MISTVTRDHHEEAQELRALFENQLRELYWAEQVMVKTLAGVISNATSKDLVAALENHTVQTMHHSLRLEKIFGITGITPESEKYEALSCLMKDAEEFIQSTRRGVVRDAGIIAVLQKIKHYEIACYGTMRAYALALREEEAVTLLEETLAEEKEADLILSGIAESHINVEAADREI
ncbi:MAG: DUF892 family protein [Flavobacterium sp.]|nr:MAG: DUF892 family protein [Flavobacterium sp.]